MLDTRKTVPCLRLLDKWAVVIGGGMNHRIGKEQGELRGRRWPDGAEIPLAWPCEQLRPLRQYHLHPQTQTQALALSPVLLSLTPFPAGLYDMVMIKDNHIAAAGGIAAAVAATEVRRLLGLSRAGLGLPAGHAALCIGTWQAPGQQANKEVWTL